VKFSARARLALAALLLLTLGLKLVWTRDAPAPDGALLVEQAEAVLRREGFATARMARPFGTVVTGNRGACRLMVGEYPPDGTLAEPLAVAARSIGPLAYIWAGETYAQPPKLRPLTDFYVRRELGRLGISIRRWPILAVATGAGCGGVRPDWTPLKIMPR
jgi:hypothetical protein